MFCSNSSASINNYAESWIHTMAHPICINCTVNINNVKDALWQLITRAWQINLSKLVKSGLEDSMGRHLVKSGYRTVWGGILISTELLLYTCGVFDEFVPTGPLKIILKWDCDSQGPRSRWKLFRGPEPKFIEYRAPGVCLMNMVIQGPRSCLPFHAGSWKHIPKEMFSYRVHAFIWNHAGDQKFLNPYWNSLEVACFPHNSQSSCYWYLWVISMHLITIYDFCFHIVVKIHAADIFGRFQCIW